MADRKTLIEAGEAFFQLATEYLVDVVPDGINWEDAEPGIDSARVAVGDVIDQMRDEMGVEQISVGSKARWGWWLVIGRVDGDDEDSAAWIRCDGEEQAIANFKRTMIDRLKKEDHAGEDDYEYDEDDEPIYINWVIFTDIGKPQIVGSPHFSFNF